MSNNTIDFETDNQMMDEGYNIGKIKYQENSKCEYLIVDETTNVKFDPINISEEIYTTFRKDTQKVYFKYRPLRMKNRCLEGQPIQITDIKKREG